MEERSVSAAGAVVVGRRAPVQVAIVGAGFIGAVHARSARLAGARIVGVTASTPERSEEAAGRLGAVRAYDVAEELVTAPEVDVVHLCTPNHLHAPLALAALAAGKHVVCEKPLAVDAVQAAELGTAAAASGRVATVPFVYRYHPMVLEARARVAAGELGAVRLVHGGYLQDWLSTPEDDSWRVDPELGGASRAFADIGSHWCDLAEFITGDRIAAVCAQSATVVPERAQRAGARPFQGGGDAAERRPVSTEDLVVMLFRTEGGVLGTMLVSQVSPGRKNHLHIEVGCELASVRFEQERPETLWLGRRERTEELWRDPAHLSPSAARHAIVPVGHPQGYLECFDAFVADTYAAIGGADPDGLPRFAAGVRQAHVTAAVLVSAERGEWVDV
ncbi:Gfo/Idh/MocA family protein [Candidatus Solirubrobacter pratensis]|uniref:Gfo/Idh/MocA family protein n=1 Tax=Candidatus Solirubrobacter pratensis TaxID=1298857 RepID=UPI0009DBD7CA